MPVCIECGNGFSSKRRDAKFCKPSCRSNNCQKRKRQEKQAKGRQKDMFIVQDMNKIVNQFPDCQSYLQKLQTIYGNNALLWAIEAIACTGVQI